MATSVRNTVAASAVLLAFASIGTAQLTDPEFRCQRRVNKAGSKFVKAKLQCASRCILQSRRGGPLTDCYPPYGGATLDCVTNPLTRRGAEERFADTVVRGCDPAFASSRDCPECYARGGDCSLAGEGADRVSNFEGQIDSLIPPFYCAEPSATDAEFRCEANTTKTLAKLVGKLNRCYDACFIKARRGVVGWPTCMPPVTDPGARACIDEADRDSIRAIDAKCRDVAAVPDCEYLDSYPDGAAWTNLIELWFAGDVPWTFCGSPSDGSVE